MQSPPFGAAKDLFLHVADEALIVYMMSRYLSNHNRACLSTDAFGESLSARGEQRMNR